jgi:hypothetical protein
MFPQARLYIDLRPEQGSSAINPLTRWHQQPRIRVYNSQFHATTMGTSPITLRSILGFLFVFVQLASALKFDLTAASGGGKNERCIRNFVSKDQLVVVTATVGGTKGDGQKVNIHVRGARTRGKDELAQSGSWSIPTPTDLRTLQLDPR